MLMVTIKVFTNVKNYLLDSAFVWRTLQVRIVVTSVG